MSIITQLGEKQGRQQHGFNDYLGPPYVGGYAPLLRVAGNVVRTLIGKEPLSPESSVYELREEMNGEWNIHMRRPDLWSARLLVVIGRRDWGALSHKHKIATVVDNFVEVASYDRLLDSRDDS